jgi:DNA-binding transcriptional LysR family regulator
MPDVNLGSIDLNLLLVVATVLETQSATRAARRLHVTQSAVSNALRRAREIFGDPLVTRQPHGFRPTALGAALLPSLRRWLEDARRIVANEPRFEPATSQRMFSIACSDAIAMVLLRPLLRVLRARAPRAGLRLSTLDRLITEDTLVRGEVDLLVGIPPYLPRGHLAEPVYEDPFACLVHARAIAGKRLSLDAFAALPHVELALFGDIDDAVDRALAVTGHSRHVKVAVASFAVIPHAVIETRGVCSMGERVARALATRELRTMRPPVKLPPLEIRQVWHERSDADEGVQFLRRAVLDAVRA